MPRARPIGSALLLALAAACIVVALLAGYARTALLDSDQFADRATAALRTDEVRSLIAERITDDAVLRANRDLVAVRPIVESAASAIVGSGAFEGLFHRAVRDLHRTAFTHDRSTATLTLVDVGVLLSGALERLDPKLARRLPAFDVRLSTGDIGLGAIDTTQVADVLDGLALVFAIAAVILLVAGVAVAPVRRRGIVHAGAAVAIAGAVVLVAFEIGRAQALGALSGPDERAAGAEVFDSFLLDLRTWALVTLGCGTVVAAAAASLLRPVDVRGPLARAWALVTTVPERPALRAGRAVALIVAGALMIAERDWLLDVALILAGVYVLYQGVEELLRMIARPPEEAEAEAAADRPARPASAARRRGALVATGVAAALIAILLAGLVGTGGTTAAADADPDLCNGRADLCDRPLDEVVMPGTHNAMSAATNPGWLFAQHEQFLGRQLADGVRALMIDVHMGERVGARVRTVLDERKELDELRREIGPAATEAALRTRDRIVGSDQAGPRTTWLCHGFCEVGAVPFVDGLREVRDFVAANPDEVVVIIIQDEGVTPADVASAFERSGLLDYVYTGPAGPPWPTLREMIASGGRVLVFAENVAGGDEVPWYHPTYEGLVQETPYHFTDRSQFSCAPNRGGTEGSLFLLNHWIDTSPAPRPSNAAVVNAYDELLGRARACQRERGLLPNILAVDFYETGDLLKVADTLNDEPEPSP
ncbi:MAG TPA: hypothetical protein VIL49_07620 [Capillimicrobium sp.]